MAGASPDAPTEHMKEKLYTVGQIAKKYHVPLSTVYEWLLHVGKKYNGFGRKSGLVPIPNAPYGRSGMPESIVNLIPHHLNKLYKPRNKSTKQLPTLLVDHSLTPKNAEKRGYEWVADVMYDREAPYEAMEDIVSLVEEDGYKLGCTLSKMMADAMQGLYRPL